MSAIIEYTGINRTVLSTEMETHLENLAIKGYSLIPDVLSPEACRDYSERLDSLNERQNAQFGEARLRQLNDYGVIRALLAGDDAFADLVTHPAVLPIVDQVVGPTAILHLQNGIVLESNLVHHQSKFHRDFAKDFVAEKVLSLNAFWMLDPFDEETGGTWLVPHTHRVSQFPSDRYLQENAIQVVASPGSVLLFDSMLIHRAGHNRSGRLRRGINQQYTRPFIKQQIDLTQQLQGRVDIETRLGQLLGFWAVPPASVEAFRVDPDQRTYRGGQG